MGCARLLSIFKSTDGTDGAHKLNLTLPSASKTGPWRLVLVSIMHVAYKDHGYSSRHAARNITVANGGNVSKSDTGLS